MARHRIVMRLALLLCSLACTTAARCALRPMGAIAHPPMKAHRAVTPYLFLQEPSRPPQPPSPPDPPLEPPPREAPSTTLSGMPTLWQAILALNACTLIWGSQHAIMKDVVVEASPASVNAARFVVAAAFALPWAPGAPWRPAPAAAPTSAGPGSKAPVSRTWAAGAELGFWTFLGFALQAVGLQLTTASRSAFLLYLNVKLVGRPPQRLQPVEAAASCPFRTHPLPFALALSRCPCSLSCSMAGPPRRARGSRLRSRSAAVRCSRACARATCAPCKLDLGLGLTFAFPTANAGMRAVHPMPATCGRSPPPSPPRASSSGSKRHRLSTKCRRRS